VSAGCLDVPGANLPPEAPCPHDNATTQQVGADADPSPALPLYHTLSPDCGGVSCNASIIAQPLNLATLSDNYADWATAFISAHATPGSNPFFLYLAESHVHVPLGHDPRFNNASKRGGIFADTLLELDATVGAVTAAIAAAGLTNDTLVLYVTDNGPWNVKCDLAGSQGPFDGAYQAVRSVTDGRGDWWVRVCVFARVCGTRHFSWSRVMRACMSRLRVPDPCSNTGTRRALRCISHYPTHTTQLTSPVLFAVGVRRRSAVAARARSRHGREATVCLALRRGLDASLLAPSPTRWRPRWT